MKTNRLFGSHNNNNYRLVVVGLITIFDVRGLSLRTQLADPTASYTCDMITTDWARIRTIMRSHQSRCNDRCIGPIWGDQLLRQVAHEVISGYTTTYMFTYGYANTNVLRV